MAFYHVGGCDCPVGCCDCGGERQFLDKYLIQYRPSAAPDTYVTRESCNDRADAIKKLWELDSWVTAWKTGRPRMIRNPRYIEFRD